VPVLVNGDRWIAGSWIIANYLEDTFPDSPSLFGGASGRDLTRYYSSLADSLGAAIFPFVAFNIWQHVADKDREYFRASREKRVGKSRKE
jgi:glutathione S-transferase